MKLHPALIDAEQSPGVSVAPILELHRGGDGFIAFGKKDTADRWVNLFSIRADELTGMFPSIQRQLTADAFFSVNAFYRGQRWPSNVEPRLPGAFRQSEGLRYLTACFVDIDCYKANRTDTAVIAKIVELQDGGTLPPASFIVRSGRGVWLMWILRDDKDPALPPRAWPERVIAYHAIQKALADRLAIFGTDAGASDPARVMRVPGSVNTKAKRPVKYYFQADDRCRGYTYSLIELADELGVEIQRTKATAAALTGDEKTKADKRRGWRAMNQRRLQQFETLRAIRGGFSQGVRNNAALIYSRVLAALGHTDANRLDELSKLADECTPKLSDAEVRAALREGSKRRRFSNSGIADRLDVTPAESAKLQGWPPARRFRGLLPDALPAATKRERIQLRRDAIKDLIGKGNPPAQRTMVELLKGLGIDASLGTVNGDYQHLGIRSVALTIGRPVKDAGQLSLIPTARTA